MPSFRSLWKTLCLSKNLSVDAHARLLASCSSMQIAFHLPRLAHSANPVETVFSVSLRFPVPDITPGQRSF